jgi:phosphoribosylaminoimidazolecarboxamide formyltransferase / IMP cyclohydrolase
MQATPPIKRALISVSDKNGLAELGLGLTAAGVEIFSTGGTRSFLEDNGVSVRDVSEYTGFPEMMDGRLKTLHPKVFGGILCRHDNESDMSAIAKHGIVSFELVVVNLYPFEATIAREGVTMAEAIEKIDIGGPSLVRAAAKNHAFTTIATSSNQYGEILESVKETGGTSVEFRRSLAGEAFAHTAKYDRAIADYFAGQTLEAGLPGTVTVSMNRKAVLRYGENPHQKAAVYSDPNCPGASVVNGQQLGGKELSYNNLMDLDAALMIARSFDRPAVSVIKHNNPCGTATNDNLAEATRRGMAGDPLSAFGSVIGFNRPVDAESAQVLAEPGLFIEGIAAPGFSPEALEILTTKPKWKANVRLVSVGNLPAEGPDWAYRFIDGGMLLQDADNLADPEEDWNVVTDAKPEASKMDDMRFAWMMVRHVKSNAIVICKDEMLLGAGAGQMSRVDSVEISIKKAGDRIDGSVLASDAFFPFADSIDRANEAGITAIIQPGGSRRDDEVIAACNKYGMSMIFTGRRHFKH